MLLKAVADKLVIEELHQWAMKAKGRTFQNQAVRSKMYKI